MEPTIAALPSSVGFGLGRPVEASALDELIRRIDRTTADQRDPIRTR